MRPVPVVEFARIVGGHAVGFDPGAKIERFALDSAESGPGALFVAIRGARVDGHEFVPAALALGAVGTLATRKVVGPHVFVDSVEDALAAFARTFRDRFEGPVIGITGSAGKTSTKEFAAAALGALGPVLKNPGNRNSEWSAPLVWADLEAGHRAVVVEMAMRGFGQIRHLAAFTRPTIGVVTNIGWAHLEQVGSREGVARAKGELLEALPASGTAVLWAGDEYLDTLRGVAPGRVLTFGFGDDADARIERYEALDPRRSRIGGTVLGESFEAELPTVGRHMAVNAAAGLLAAAVAGAPVKAGAARLAEAELPKMRMEIVSVGGATVLFDAYNASPPGVLAAIETLRDIPCGGERTAVLGEMRELGDASEGAHREIGEALARAGVRRALFFGPLARVARDAFQAAGGEAAWTERIEEVAAFLQGLSPGDLALVKGSRALELERALEGVRT